MKIKVISDSTCDLPRSILEKYDIDLVPLFVIKDEQEFIDGETITPDAIFRHVANGGSLCSTAARSVSTYQEKFAKYADNYDGVIHINISSEISSSYQNAMIASQDFANVRIVDSRNLSVGQGLIVMKACELGESCTDMDSLKAELDAYAEKVETSFVLDRLDYMVKGGRCSAAAALGANLLNLKPCIEVKDGKLSVVKKYRGHYDKVLASYTKDRITNRHDLDRSTLFIVHTTIDESCFEAVNNAVREAEPFGEVIEAVAGCTISCHCGPGTLGVIFVRK